ncbi:sugar phosphate exchanger 3-like isoform X1 [Dysidea avara]|uniref:sugar phosphate exchanger 3-like isoform X1 n=2 Tax=Dysidea avara TaxID=196820 RepID=UPI0033281708
MFFSIVEHPKCVGLSSPDGKDDLTINVKADLVNDNDQREATPLLKPTSDPDIPTSPDHSMMIHSTKQQTRNRVVHFFKAFCIPGVAVYALSYACLKLVNYSFFFWLPYYLNKAYPSWATPTEAALLSTLYDVGGIIGCIVGGIISDLVGRRCPIVVTMLLSAMGFLFVYQAYGDTPTKNAILMAIAGVFVGGPANLISSAISADLRKQPALKGDSEALSTVTGIIDGTGSVGAAIGQTIIPIINIKPNGWEWVFYFLMGMLFCSALFLSELFYRDIRSLGGVLCNRLRSYSTRSKHQ